MEFINKATLIDIFDKKISGLNTDAQVIRDTPGAMEQKRPHLDAIFNQVAIWQTIRNEVSIIPVFHTEPLMILRGN